MSLASCLNPVAALGVVLGVAGLVAFPFAAAYLLLGSHWRTRAWSSFFRTGSFTVPASAYVVIYGIAAIYVVAAASWLAAVSLAWIWCIFFEPNLFQQTLSGVSALVTFVAVGRWALRGLRRRRPRPPA